MVTTPSPGSDELGEFEHRFLTTALKELPNSVAWMPQVAHARAASREYDDFGVTCALEIPVELATEDRARRGLRTINLNHDQLQTGAYGVVWVDEGRLLSYELCVWDPTETFPRDFNFIIIDSLA